MKPCRYRLAGSIRVKVLLSGDPHLFPAVHFGVFNFMHTVNDIMRDLGFQFVRVMPEHVHFGNGNQPRFLKFVNVVGNSVKCFVDAVQRMVNAQFVKLSNSQSASNQGAWVRAAFGLIHRALPVSVYRLLTRLAQYRPTVITGGQFKLGHYPQLSSVLLLPAACSPAQDASWRQTVKRIHLRLVWPMKFRLCLSVYRF